MDLLNVLFSNQKVLNTIGKQLGFSNGIPPQYIALASTVLFSALSNKSKEQGGAKSILDGLMNSGNQNQGILGNLIGSIPSLLGGKSNNGLLSELFSDKENPVIDSFSKATGLNGKQSKQILMLVGTVVFAYLSKKVQEKNMDEKELSKEIQNTYSKPKEGPETHDDGGILEQIFGGKKQVQKTDSSDDLTDLLRNLILK